MYAKSRRLVDRFDLRYVEYAAIVLPSDVWVAAENMKGEKESSFVDSSKPLGITSSGGG